MNDFLIAGLSFMIGFAMGMSVVTMVVGRWVWSEFQKQKEKSADGEGFPKPSPFVKN